MTTLSGLGSGIKSIQTAYVNTAPTGNSTGEDLSYLDITISSVDTTKCVIIWDGVFASISYAPISAPGTTYYSYLSTARLTSSTNLRLSAARTISAHTFCGRYQVIEFY